MAKKLKPKFIPKKYDWTFRKSKSSLKKPNTETPGRLAKKKTIYTISNCEVSSFLSTLALEKYYLKNINYD